MKMEKSRKKELLEKFSSNLFEVGFIAILLVFAFGALGIFSHFVINDTFAKWSFIIAGVCFIVAPFSLVIATVLDCLVEDL